MELDLYAANVSPTDVSNWVERISVTARAQGIQVLHASIKEARETFQEQFPVVFDDLCVIPELRLSFHGSDETALTTFAYNSYRSRLEQGWNVCLYCPSRDAIFLHFDDRLLARKVAHLYYQQGTSDKVYHLYLAQALRVDFCSVISRYGRRGGTLQQTEKSFDYRLEEAEKEWVRLHHDKIQKGYQIGRPTVPKQLELELPF
ncbi:WGR domain-containing protein [Candidatus Poribacteria bacterium]|nr:WGR domain-containing protein [Candidatus Poribacteria bacterium]